MKLNSHFTLAVCSFALLLPVSARPGAKVPKVVRRLEKLQIREALHAFDFNGNGEIDGAERETLRSAFDEDDGLKWVDKNGNGRLEDEEIDVIKVANPGKSKESKKKNT